MGLQVLSSVATIGSFFINGIGLGHTLEDNYKHPSGIIEEARKELSSALAILDSFEAVIQDDFMIPLVERYRNLDTMLKKLEKDMRLPKGFKQALNLKSYISDKRIAKETCLKVHNLHHDILVASDSGKFAALLKKKNLTHDGKHMPSTPHPTPVAGSLVPFYSREYEISPTYPPLPRVGSLASIRSDPFRDPLVTTPVN